jgi:nitrogen fixation protein FixH
MSTSRSDHRATPREAGAPRSFFKRGLHWPVLVAIVFLSNIALATWVIVKANSDPSFAVEDDYYEKALNWNDEIDQRERNAELGWTVTVEGQPRIAGGGWCDLRLRIVDRDGAPISGAQVKMEAMPVARGDDKHLVALDEVLPGSYVARLENARFGRWQLRVHIDRGEDVFAERLSAMIAKGS